LVKDLWVSISDGLVDGDGKRVYGHWLSVKLGNEYWNQHVVITDTVQLC